MARRADLVSAAAVTLRAVAAALLVWLPLELTGRPPGPLDLIAAAVAGAVGAALHLERSPSLPTPEGGAAVARRKSSEYRREATREPFELVMDQTNDDGSEIVVTFGDPNVMECETAFDLAEEQYPREQLRRMLGNPDGTDNGQWDLFWREWRSRQVGDLNELLDDVMKHYGADRGKPARSSR